MNPLEKPDPRGFDETQWRRALEQLQQPYYRAKQIREWLVAKRVCDPQQMTNLPKQLRNTLATQWWWAPAEIVTRREDPLDGTVKWLLRLADGETVETVLMRYKSGNTVCVSSQVGCHIGCRFCASSLHGLVRNCSAAEMIEQVLTADRELARQGERVDRVVVMGSGEPFENYTETMRFVDLLIDPDGMGIGQRHVTVSTSGMVPRIYDFAERHLQVRLAISLHAPSDAIRTQLVPLNRKWPIDKVLEAAQAYVEETHRRVSFEYAMIHGVNDAPEHAEELAERIKDLRCLVNLIPLNEVPERGMVGSTPQAIHAFQEKLQERGIVCTVRRSLGRTIDAACGQLRAGFVSLPTPVHTAL